MCTVMFCMYNNFSNALKSTSSKTLGSVIVQKLKSVHQTCAGLHDAALASFSHIRRCGCMGARH